LDSSKHPEASASSSSESETDQDGIISVMYELFVFFCGQYELYVFTLSNFMYELNLQNAKWV